VRAIANVVSDAKRGHPDLPRTGRPLRAVLRPPSLRRVPLPVLAAGVLTWPPTRIFAWPADSGGSARVIRLNRSGGRSVFIKEDLGLHGAIR